MELIIAFLLEKGGIFGLLFLLSLVYIWWTGRGKVSSDEDEKEIEKKLEKIIEKVSAIESNIAIGNATRLEYKKVADKMQESMQQANELIKDLWDWHAVKDADGVPIWYVKRSLHDNIKNLTDEMKVNADKLVVNSQDLARLNEDRVEELKEILTNYNKTLIDLTVALEKIRSTIRPRGENQNG